MQVSKLFLIPILIPLWFAFLPFRIFDGVKEFISEVNRRKEEKYGSTKIISKKKEENQHYETLTQLHFHLEEAEKKRKDAENLYHDAISAMIGYIDVFSHRTQKYEKEQQIQINHKDKQLRRLQDSLQKEQRQLKNFHAKMGTYERQLKEKREDIANLERRVREAEKYQMKYDEERKRANLLEKDLLHEREVIKSLANELEDSRKRFQILHQELLKEKKLSEVNEKPLSVQQELPPSIIEGTIVLEPQFRSEEEMLSELATQLGELLQLAELPEGNFEPAVQSYLSSFNEPKSLQQLMEEYPFVLTQYPTEPEMSLQIMSRWEDALFSQLEKEEASRVRREIVNEILRTHPEDIPHRAESIRMTYQKNGDFVLEKYTEDFRDSFGAPEEEEEEVQLKQKSKEKKKHEAQRKKEEQRQHEKVEKEKHKERKKIEEEKKEKELVEEQSKQMKEKHEKELKEKREKQEKAAKERQEKALKEKEQEKLTKDKPEIEVEIPIQGLQKRNEEEQNEEEEGFEKPKSRSAKRRSRKKANQEAIAEAEIGLEDISLSKSS